MSNKSYLKASIIRNIDLEDIRFAKSLNYTIKLLAIAERIGNKVKQRVHPCLIPNNLDVANIDNVINAVVVDGYR